MRSNVTGVQLPYRPARSLRRPKAESALPRVCRPWRELSSGFRTAFMSELDESFNLIAWPSWLKAPSLLIALPLDLHVPALEHGPILDFQEVRPGGNYPFELELVKHLGAVVVET